MKKTLPLLAVIILSFMIYKPCAHALSDTCTSTEKIRLRELATATKISYEYYETANNISGGTFHGYKVSIINFKPDFYVYDTERATYFSTTNDSVAISDSFLGGITYKLPFYASDGTICEGYLIMTKYIKMPYYNPYWEDPLCDGHEDYILCKKFNSVAVDSKDEFDERMKAYIKSLVYKDNQDPVETPINEKSAFEKIADFVIDHYMYFLISIIILGTAAIVFIEVKRRRNIL